MEHISDNDINALYSVIYEQSKKTKHVVDRLIRAIQTMRPSPQKTKTIEELICFSQAIVSELATTEWLLLESHHTISYLASKNRILENRVRLLEEQNDTLNDVFNVACKLLKK